MVGDNMHPGAIAQLANYFHNSESSWSQLWSLVRAVILAAGRAPKIVRQTGKDENEDESVRRDIRR